MSCINIIGEMVKADEEKSEIKLKLEEIRKIRTSFNIDVSRFRKMIDRDKLNQEEIERDNEKYKIIAKLSFDLFMDYEYYREFPIKNDSRFVNCAEELKSLGYELRESAEWVNVRRPNMDTIIDQIFLSHLCQSILTRCVCCDAITRDGQSECDKCLNESNEQRIKTNVTINHTGIINEELYQVNNGWNCSSRLCGWVNRSSDRYCEFCGIERSSNFISGVNNQSNVHEKSTWRCDSCEWENDTKFRSCMYCKIPKTAIWTCSCCSKENNESTEQCEACGQINEKANNKKCLRCQQNGTGIDELCFQCLSNRESDWNCSYRSCRNRNKATDDYCKKCGLYQYGIKKHGAPNKRMIDNKCSTVWVCFDCCRINKWEVLQCDSGKTGQNSSRCHSKRNKYFSWCKSCGNENSKDEVECSQCKQML